MAKKANRKAPEQWPAACTIIAANYLSHARILAESYTRHHPGATFYLLVVDGLPADVPPIEGMRLVDADELGLPDYADMSLRYSVTELSTAVKPSLLTLLLEQYGEVEVIYLDPDILVLRPFAELRQAWATGDIVLTPHLLKPLPNDGLEASERSILAAGGYNLGFIAVRQSGETRQLLRWWEEHLREDCRVDPSRGLMVDQRWMDLAPHLFPATMVALRDDTYNVAYWNIHSRTIEKDDQARFLINGRPLTFFHFSGFDPENPQRLSKHENRTQLAEGTPLTELTELYACLHMEHGFAVSSRWRYGHETLAAGTFDNGIPSHPLLQQLYTELAPQERGRFSDPWRTAGPDSFFAWATAPRPAQGRHSRFLETIYRLRPDVAATFPEPTGRHQAAFLEWARTHGVVELGYDPRLVYDDPARSAAVPEAVDAEISSLVSGQSAPGAVSTAVQTTAETITVVSAATQRSSSEPVHPDGSTVQAGVATLVRRPSGVNVSGYLHTQDGLGFVARSHIRALRSLAVPLAFTDLSALNPNPSSEHVFAPFDPDNPYDVNLVCVNADQHFRIKEQLGPDYFADRYNIGVWFWELPYFPLEWHDRFADYSELWVATSFIANTLSPISPIPVVRVPPPLVIEATGSRERGRNRLQVTADESVFLFTFNFRSYFDRKNPLAVIEAFRTAFRPTEPVRLVIKCVNPEVDPKRFAEMTTRAQGYPISIYTDHWTEEEMRDLAAACDAYVSLHRSEGLALTIAEAMANGKPVIATDWSGNADLMNAGNSYPVSYRLVEITEDVGPYRAGGIWAEPSVEHAATLMRLVHEDRDEAAARGQAAKREIATSFSVDSVGKVIQRRLSTIGERSQPEASRQHGRLALTVKVASPLEAVELDGTFDNGIPSHPLLQQLYTELAPQERGRFSDPWRTAGPDSFFAWATAPRPAQGRHSRFLETIYRLRPDVAATFPEPTGRHQAAFLEWARTKGAVEFGYDPRLVRMASLAARIREVVRIVLPRDVNVLVTTEGNNELLRLGDRQTQPFPRVPISDQDSQAPIDTGTAIVQLDALRAEGAEFLLIPGSAYQRLSQLTGFRRYLDMTHARIWEDDCCTIYQLAGVDNRLRVRTLPVINAHLLRHDRASLRLHDLEMSVAETEARLNQEATRFEELAARVKRLEKESAGLGHRFATRPYMAADEFGAFGDLDRPMGYSLDEPMPTDSLGGLRFADLFRGSEAFTMDRQRPYLPFFDGRHQVVDLGCGRGEFLRLLRDLGIPATGVELDPLLVATCQAQGLDVEEADALDYLRDQASASLDAVFSAQLIERLTSEQRIELLGLARDRLRAGGLFIAETVNPESFEAFKRFSVDPTHQTLIFPQVLLFECREAGYRSARIFYPTAGGFTQRQYQTADAYAVIAVV